MKKKLVSCGILVMTLMMMSFIPVRRVHAPESNTTGVVEEAVPFWLLGLFGLEVDYKRGMRVNPGDGCSGRGVCELHISTGGGITKPIGEIAAQTHHKNHTYTGFDDIGNLFILVFNPSDEEWMGTSFQMDGDFQIPSEIARACGKTAYTIRKGNYAIEKDAARTWAVVKFVKR